MPAEATMITLKIYRFNPENPDAQGLSFRVLALPTDRLLNLLLYVKGLPDGTLTFRRSYCTRCVPVRTRCASTASTGSPANC